jgi:hypothetical protein
MSMMIRPYAFAAGAAPVVPVTRQVYSSESLAEVTNTNSASPTTLVSLTFTPDANKAYVIFWSAEHSIATAGQRTVLRFREAGSDIILSDEAPKEASTPVDYWQRGGFTIYPASASPASTTWDITVVRSGASGTARARNGRLVAMRLENGDDYAVSTGADTVTGTTYGDKASLVVNAGAGQDYLVLASASLEPGTSNNIRFRAEHGGANSYVAEMRDSGGAAMAAGIAWARTGLTGSNTFKTQFSAASGGVSVVSSKHRILALALGAVYDNDTSTLGSDSAGTDIAYTDALSLTATPAAADYLLIASWFMKGSNSTVSTQSQLRDGGTSLTQSIAEQRVGAADGMGCFIVKAATYTAASRTWDIQRLSEANTVTNTILAGAIISTLQLQP